MFGLLKLKSGRGGFTLVEIVIVMAIVSFISTIVVVILNPLENLRQARDSKRVQDLVLLDRTLRVVEVNSPNSYFGESQVMYVSVPDSTSTCANLGLPSLPDGWSYGCSTSENLRKTDGTGWIPVDFTGIHGISITALPVDPVNSTSSEQYYTYTHGSWMLTAAMESGKYRAVAEDVSEGVNPERYQVGSDPDLILTTIYGGAAPIGGGSATSTFSAANSSLAVSSYVGVSDSSSTISITVTVRDTENVAIEGAEVTLSVTGSGNTVSSPAVTDASGQTTATLISSVSEEKTISALVGGVAITQTQSVAFNSSCSGTDYGGANYTISTTTNLSSSADTTLCNVGTFTVASGGTLNLGATRKFQIYATNADISGSINGSGKGYICGDGPGHATNSYSASSHGGVGQGSLGLGPTYGSATSTSDMGSGGPGGAGCSAGGGYVKIVASGTLTVDGKINVNSASTTGSYGGSSGGGIYLSAGTFAGGGTISADAGYAGASRGAGGGRISAIYGTKYFSGNMSANGKGAGGSGTIFQKQTGQLGTITIDNNSVSASGYTTLDSTVMDAGSVGSVIVDNGAVAYWNDFSAPSVDVTLNSSGTLVSFGASEAEDIVINSGGTMVHAANTSAQTNIIDMTASSLNIASGGSVNVLGKGYACAYGPGLGASSNGGSAYGGDAQGTTAGSAGVAYGSITSPSDMGSGSPNAAGCSAGGGYAKLLISGTLNVDGTINANGAPATGSYGGSSGGGIYLSAGTLSGDGTISANAGSGSSGRGGGGGRIAVYYGTDNFTGDFNAFGSVYGGSGTVFQKQTGQPGVVTIGNNSVSAVAYTPIDSTFMDDALVGSVVVKTGSLAYWNNFSSPSTDITLNASGTLVSFGASAAGDITINSGGTMTHAANTSAQTNIINMTASSLNIASGGSVNVLGKGYACGYGPGVAASGNAGSGYGGAGQGTGAGTTYGSATSTSDMGSGGASAAGCAAGGGYAKFLVSGTMTVDGTINANGANATGAYGGSAGGGIYISAGTLAGGGSVSANAGSGASGKGGGGGRIAAYYGTKTFSGTMTAAKSQSATDGTVFDGGASSAPGPLGYVGSDVNYLANLGEAWSWLFKGLFEGLKGLFR